MRVVAIIPALNEFERLQRVVQEVLDYVDFVVVIDDGSRDPLARHLASHDRLRILRHAINLGKGAGMKTGVFWAREAGFDAAIFIDADGQHNPAEIPTLLSPLKSDQAQIVFGIRHFHGRMPLVAKLGNIFLTRALQFLFQVRIDDTQSGFRAVLLSAYNDLAWQSARYSVETEMIVNTGKKKLRYAQVPITTIYHDKYKGTTIIDGVRIMLNMITWRFT